MFCGFSSPLLTYLPAITRLRKYGFSVISFNFRTRAILSLSIDTLPVVINEVAETATALEKTNKTKTPPIVIGNSMGSVFAWHTAARVPSVHKIVANTGYALISKHIFEDKIGRSWRKVLMVDGIDEKAFHEQILAYEPISVFDKLTGKSILIFLNRDDNVISFSNSVLYKKVLEDNNIPYEYFENSNMRHGTAIMKNLLSKRLLEFLNA